MIESNECHSPDGEQLRVEMIYLISRPFVLLISAARETRENIMHAVRVAGALHWWGGTPRLTIIRIFNSINFIDNHISVWYRFKKTHRCKQKKKKKLACLRKLSNRKYTDYRAVCLFSIRDWSGNLVSNPCNAISLVRFIGSFFRVPTQNRNVRRRSKKMETSPR